MYMNHGVFVLLALAVAIKFVALAVLNFRGTFLNS